ncbi:MAG: DNA repair protein RecO [Nitrospirae bacterium GWF2_44_13]|nr:MAG: DNA repair protein RecO [Nitrospirae bacterium GWF2_44_13]OGW34274.1 MAG: DNA repair protein RecO [Nitrospirae bacterium GWD2_44_7]OGW66467.1 MAG: DNA repair protein RecO [Nitrospirae bacterium RIFOXYA2_FULL_44_9]OGW73075.1 MAG: DNA repair protein RecO [Nitrospirae bacterium RIFOXYC2_FULL_44_7]HBG92264.1 DNA repair protein RecO [Nitrospiraceae bacterium]
MLKRTEGIVLKTIPFGEADLIVTFLSYDFGLIKAFAKSPRKIKSRFGSSLEPLTYLKIAFWGKEDANLPRLTQSDIILPFKSLRERLDCFLKASEIIELTVNMLPEHEANKKIFTLLLDILKTMEKDCAALHTVIMYKVKFLDLAGYAPRLDGCARCGKSGFSFYVSHGAILCENCATGADSHAGMVLSQGSIKLYESLRKWDNSLAGRIKPSGNLFAELSGMINDHIRYTLSKPLKSSAFHKM